MNAYAALAIGSTLLIPGALLYRVLNPLKPRKSERQKAWEIKRQSLPEMPAGISINPGRGDAKWINDKWVPNAVVAAEAARVADVRRAEVAAFNANPVVKVVTFVAEKTIAGCIYAVLGIIALVLLAIPAFLIFGLFGLFAIKLVALGLLIAWCLNDFKNDIADEVVSRQKKSRSDVK